ncbi:MAG: protoporphyrinogen oxidase [Opitutaceae bacterium]
MAKPSSKSIAVLGGGITGLTAAFRLTQRGHPVRLFEATNRIGGAIRTECADGWLIEAGPNSLLAGDPAVTALIDELGLGQERVAASPQARKRYIVRNGKLMAAPLSPPALLRSALFSTGAKFRVVRELLRRRVTRTGDVSLEEFGRDHFGQEIVDYGLNPLVGGVYAGTPKNLSARHAFPKLWQAEQTHGSLLRAQIGAARSTAGKTPAGIISFRRGLQSLPDAIAARLPDETLLLNARVEALEAVAGSGWTVIWNDGASSRTDAFDAVIAALPAPALAQLRFRSHASGAKPETERRQDDHAKLAGERLLASLDAIEHPPVSSLFLGYRREDVAHPLDGFGILVPEMEQRSILGVLFSSTLFPGRAPDGAVALTVLVGGTRSPDLAGRSKEALLATVEPDLRQLLGVRGPVVFQRHTFWPRAIPQYNLGYERHLETMANVERTHRRLHIGGQARDGISLPACIAAGERLAGRISQDCVLRV